MKMPEQIETQRLILRPPNLEDASTMFYGWAQDPDVTRYLTWRPHTSLQASHTVILGAMAAWKTETRFPYMITLKETNEVAGMIATNTTMLTIDMVP